MLNFSKSLALLVLFAVAVSVSFGADKVSEKRYAADPALIEVLQPYLLGQCSPASINLDPNFYERYRASMAFLIRQQPLYLRLLRQSDAVRQTQWFKSAGHGEEAETVLVNDLNRHLIIDTPGDTMLITVSMVVITNEIVNLFITRQEEKAKSVLRRKLQRLNQQYDSMRSETRSLENTLNDIRQGTSFPFLDADLNDHYLSGEYSGLLGKKNELKLEIAGLETEVDLLRRKAIEEEDAEAQAEADAKALEKQTSKKPTTSRRKSSRCQSCETRKSLQKSQDKLIVLNAKLDVVNDLIVKSKMNLKSLSLIRADYLKVKNQRDGIRAALKEMESKIMDISILHDDAELSRLKLLQMADESLIVSEEKEK